MLRNWISALLVVGLAGCAGQAALGPEDTLHAYADALRSGRVQEAYALLSNEAKQQMSFDAFARSVRERPDEAREIANSLSRPTEQPVLRATVTTPDGESLHLSYEAGEWRIDRAAIEPYAQDTPQQAVTAFVRAFDRKRYDVLMKLVPEARLSGLSAAKLKVAWEGSQKDEMLRIVQAVKSALSTAKFEEFGDRATMRFGTSGTVQLLREHGVWKIEDLD